MSLVETARPSWWRRVATALCPYGVHASDVASYEDYAYEAAVEASILGRTNAMYTYTTEMALLADAYDRLETADMPDNVRTMQMAAIETRLRRLHLQKQSTQTVTDKYSAIRAVVYSNNQRSRNARELMDMTDFSRGFAEHVTANVDQREMIMRQAQEAQEALAALDTNGRTADAIGRQAEMEARLRAEAAVEVSAAANAGAGILGLRQADAYVALAASGTPAVASSAGGRSDVAAAHTSDLQAILAASRRGARASAPKVASGSESRARGAVLLAV